MLEIKDKKTEGLDSFIGAFLAAFAIVCLCVFFGIGFSIYATPATQLYIVIGSSVVAIALAGAAILFFRDGKKKAAMGIIIGALAPLFVFGGCLLAFRGR